jgi:hypothetical protein
MNAFLRASAGELMKLRRTLAFWMVFAAPLLVLALEVMMFHQRADYFARQHKPLWDTLHRNSFALWSILMLPLYVTLQTSLLAGLEHTEDRWRGLLAYPVPRWAIYWAKLVIPLLMVAVSSFVLTMGGVAGGLALRNVKPVLLFPGPAPWGRAAQDAALTLATALLIITIHHWVSLRFRTFAASIGFGISACVGAFMLARSDEYGPWWPWCLPLQLLSEKPNQTTHALVYSALGALVVAVLGTVEFTRRDIQ